MSVYLVCEQCGKPVMPGASADARKLGGVCLTDGFCIPKGPVNSTNENLKSERESARGTNLKSMPEKLLVARIVHVLESRGCTVIQTGQRRAKGSGTTVGCPDLFVWTEPMVLSNWIGLEIKTPEGRLSKEQQILVDAGQSFLVRNEREALEAVGLA